MLSKVRALLVLALAVLATAVAAPGAAAEVTCRAGEVPVTQQMPDGTTYVVDCQRPVDPGGPPPRDPDDDTSGDTSGGASPECTLDSGKVIPCSTDKGRWDQGRQCYASVNEDPPPKGSPIWEGHDEGYIISCVLYWNCPETGGVGEWRCQVQSYWSLRPPGVTGPSALELAERAVARMQMSMGEIGSTPPSTEVDGDAIGIVGMPVWLWVSNPGESTTGPITRSESDGGLAVTATATVDRIEWSLTDDDTGKVYATTTCAGDRAPGTPWSEAVSDDASPSPTCGFDGAENRRAGNITVTGTAYWTVEWEGGGENGTIDVPPQTRESTLAIGEAQVLVQ
ncbi:hypothetical protein AAG589_13380 [Isoptericola sp. F-RaC21]|uniref:hypothetical protein n=1 Tax=Isoptericola sp. F-RaC21 TaxID=3141452 RepID=UPI00315C11AC